MSRHEDRKRRTSRGPQVTGASGDAVGKSAWPGCSLQVKARQSLRVEEAAAQHEGPVCRATGLLSITLMPGKP